MKRSLGLVAALILSTSLAAVSAGSADAAQAKVLSRTQLRHALLTVDDLPKGFKVDHSAATESDDVDVSSDDAACQDSLEMVEPARAPGQVSESEADFKRERDSGFQFSYEAATVGLTAFRSAAAVRRDFATSAPQFRACHAIAMDMGDGTTMSFAVHSKVRRIDGNRTFVLSMHGRYMGIPMNMVMTVSQSRSYEVATMLMGANKSPAYVTKVNNSLLRAQTAKLAQQLR